MTSPENKTPVLLSNRYQVLSVLGDGGFGKTFLVEDTQMPSNRRCVLKQLKPVEDNPQTSQMVKDRFQREAAILERLGEQHEQIPRLYAYFSEADQFYLVEEWVEGDTLTQRVQREGVLSEKTVQTIIAELLPAIAHVHKEGIVHRDIKPDNILLRASDGKPALIDFGAVKETMNTLVDSHAHSSHSIVVGTPGYMPAEQMAGRPVFASDIYSIGMTAIYMLTGKIPQELDIDPKTGELQWRQHAPNVSTEFANFLNCAIHMNAQSRFPVVQEMHSILNTLILNNMSAPEPAFPETRQSSQTIISAPPSAEDATGAAANGVAGGAAAPAYAYQNQQYQSPLPGSSAGGPSESANTQMMAPGMNSTVQQPATQIAQPSQAFSGQQPVYQQPSAPSGQWKNAVIVGGMIGFSVLLGALVVMERLPGAIGGKSDDVEEVASATDSPEGTKKPEQTEAEKAAEEAALKAAKADAQKAAATPVTPPPAPPQAAATPGANSSIVGQPGSKNVRSGAGTNYGVVTSVIVGDRVKIVDRSTDGGGNPWYRIITPGGNSGWIAGQLIQVDGDAAPPSGGGGGSTPPTPPPPADNTNATIAGQPGSKNIRSGPGTSYSAVHEAYPGDRVVIQTSSTDSGGYTWHKVYFPNSGAEGWIAAQLVSVD